MNEDIMSEINSLRLKMLFFKEEEDRMQELSSFEYGEQEIKDLSDLEGSLFFENINELLILQGLDSQFKSGEESLKEENLDWLFRGILPDVISNFWRIVQAYQGYHMMKKAGILNGSASFMKLCESIPAQIAMILNVMEDMVDILSIITFQDSYFVSEMKKKIQSYDLDFPEKERVSKIFDSIFIDTSKKVFAKSYEFKVRSDEYGNREYDISSDEMISFNTYADEIVSIIFSSPDGEESELGFAVYMNGSFEYLSGFSSAKDDCLNLTFYTKESNFLENDDLLYILVESSGQEDDVLTTIPKGFIFS